MKSLKQLPLVSIIIPNYNRENLIVETLDSVLNQSYQNWECIIVDDGSTDETQNVVLGYTKSENRFRLLQRKRLPKGASTCRNIGINNANGEYIIFLDSDDLLAPYCIEQRVNKIYKTDFDLIVFPMMYFNKKILDSNILFSVENQQDDLSRFLQYNFPWSITCPIWNINAIKKLNGFTENTIGGAQDWELHIRAIIAKMKYKKYFSELPDCFYRKHFGDRISNSLHSNKIKCREKIYWEIFTLLESNKMLNNKRKCYFAGVMLQLVCIPFLQSNSKLALQKWKLIAQRFNLNVITYRSVGLYLWLSGFFMHKYTLIDKIFKRVCLSVEPNLLPPINKRQNTVNKSVLLAIQKKLK